MDSITHVVIGGALGELTLGKKIGNKAIIVGAIANTIPDLDVFTTKLASTPEMAMHFHRGYTHAFFTHPFMAIPFAYLTYRIFKKEISFFKWYLFFLLGFVTHVLLDGGTAYGTQMFLPFTNKLISWNNLAVVDPLFTIAPLLFFIAVWFFKKENNFRRKFAFVSLLISLLYLGTSTIHKFNSARVFKQNLKEKNITVTDFTSTPTMFTSWLWNMIAYNDSTMYLAEYSVFQKSKKIEIVSIPRNLQSLNTIKNSYAVQTAIWFSEGKYFTVPVSNDTTAFFITKWGRGDFSQTDPFKMMPFYSKLYKDKNGKVSFQQVEPDFTNDDFKNYFSMLKKRIFEY